jgi:hypothetical protein
MVAKNLLISPAFNAQPAILLAILSKLHHTTVHELMPSLVTFIILAFLSDFRQESNWHPTSNTRISGIIIQYDAINS